MFRNLKNGANRLFGGNKWVVVAVVLVIVFLLFSYSKSKGSFFDKMTDGSSPDMSSQASATVADQASIVGGTPSGNFSTLSSNTNYTMQPVANPAELLPKDKNSEWASLNPVSSGGIQTPDLLQAGYHQGINTIGQTLKNASMDLRSDPIIEKKSVGPWNNSSYEADYARVPLEIGYGQR